MVVETLLFRDPISDVVVDYLKCVRNPQSVRDMLAFRSTGEDAILDQASDLKLSGNQQRKGNEE